MRVLARDVSGKNFVNVTVRGAVRDLTSPELRVSAYIHRNRKTVSGRLILNRGSYVFIENNGSK